MNSDQPILLFDGVCNLCNSLVRFIIKRDRKAKIRFSPLQSAAGKSMLLKSELRESYLDSVVFIKGDKYFLRSSAILHLLNELGGAWKLFYGFLIIPPFMRDFIYRVIARTRYKVFGRTDSCMVPDEKIKSRFIID